MPDDIILQDISLQRGHISRVYLGDDLFYERRNISPIVIQQNGTIDSNYDRVKYTPYVDNIEEVISSGDILYSGSVFNIVARDCKYSQIDSENEFYPGNIALKGNNVFNSLVVNDVSDSYNCVIRIDSLVDGYYSVGIGVSANRTAVIAKYDSVADKYVADEGGVISNASAHYAYTGFGVYIHQGESAYILGQATDVTVFFVCGEYDSGELVHGYLPIVVNVPNSYHTSDEGKIVSGGQLVDVIDMSEEGL